MFLTVALGRVLVAHVVRSTGHVAAARDTVRERVVAGDAVVAHTADHVLSTPGTRKVLLFSSTITLVRTLGGYLD